MEPCAASRPSIPPILAAALAFWLAEALLLSCCDTALVSTLLPVALALGVLCALALGFCLYKKSMFWLAPLIALAFCLGVMCSSLYLVNLDTDRSSLYAESGNTYRVQIVEDEQSGLYGTSVSALVYEEESAEVFVGQPLAKVRLFDSDSGFRYGDVFTARLTFSLPSDAARTTYNSKGIAVGAKAYRVTPLPSSLLSLITQFRNQACDWLDDETESRCLNTDAVSLIKAIVLGDRADLFSSGLYQKVKVLGLAHIVAVSGAHLVIVSALLQTLCRCLRIPRKATVVLVLLFLIVYSAVVAFPVSCIRAACMAAVSLVSTFSNRRSYPLGALGLVVLGMVAVDPSAACSLSFQLSFLSTLGIVVFMPLTTSWLPAVSARFSTWVAEPFCMTLCALLPTAALSMASFSQWSLISPVSNIVAAPLVTVLCSVGLLLALLHGVPGLNVVLLGIEYFGASAFIQSASPLTQVPYACIPVDVDLFVGCVVSIFALIALWLAWPKRISLKGIGVCSLLCAALLVVGCAANAAKNNLVALDVGQGDAILLQSAGSTMLIDTGNNSADLLSALARNGVTHLDALAITHADDDHCGCVEDMARIVTCDTVLLATGMKDCEDPSAEALEESCRTLVGEEGIREIAEGSHVQVGNFDLELLSPAAVQDAGNEDSLVFLLRTSFDDSTQRAWTALLTGDAEQEVLEGLIDSGVLESVDVYKVGHHGSKNALNETVVAAIEPEVSLISVGEGNTYGHPNEITLDYLESVESTVFRTDLQGDVVCSFTSETISVSTMR